MIVTLYSLPTNLCRDCWSTERRLAKRLAPRNVTVEKVRVDLDPEAMAKVKALGYSKAPVVVVREGDTVVDHWAGYSETKIAAL